MSDSNVAKKRIVWIDIAKGLTILTVIWGHTLANGTFARAIICSFHMPLLFILSGYTMKPARDCKGLVNRTKKDFIRLVIPVLIIVAIEGVLNVLLRNSTFEFEVRNYILKIFWSSGLSPAGGIPGIGMPWCMISLFTAKLILRLFSLVSKDDYPLMGILLGFLGVVLGARRHFLPFNLDVSLVCAMFVSIGILASRYSTIISRYKDALFIISCLYIYSVFSSCGWVDFAGHNYTLVALIEGVCASYIVCTICKVFSSVRIIYKIFCVIGVNTMSIFLVHHLDGFYSFLYANNNMYIKCVIRTILALLFAWAFSYILRLLKSVLFKKDARI